MDINFNCVADYYDEIFSKHIVEYYLKKRVSFIRKYFKLRKKILDIGCGTGILLEQLSEYGFDVYGIDKSEKMIEKASRKLKKKVIVANATNLPFSSNSFEGVICIATLHHIGMDFIRVFREVSRVLKPGGYFLIWDHNPLNPYWKIIMRKVPQDTGKEHLFSCNEIVKQMRTSGFRIIFIRKSGFIPDFVPFRLLPLFSFFEKGLENIPLMNLFMAHNIILGEKCGEIKK